jgi:hypothetical protein
MATNDNEIRKSNNLIKIFTGGTSHNRRLLTNNDIMTIHNVEVHVPIISQPICEHCERIVIWSQTRGTFGEVIPLGMCKYCGTITKNPMTYGEWLAAGHDIPNTVVGRDRADSIRARQMLNAWLNIEGKDNRDEVFE